MIERLLEFLGKCDVITPLLRCALDAIFYPVMVVGFPRRGTTSAMYVRRTLDEHKIPFWNMRFYNNVFTIRVPVAKLEELHTALHDCEHYVLSESRKPVVS